MMQKENVESQSNSVPLEDLGVLSISIQHAMHTSDGKKMLEVNTQIMPHELLCLFGHSGAGKTTILRILAGLTKPDKGRIVFGDRSEERRVGKECRV